MATERQRARYRSGVGDTSGTVWTNQEVDDKFTDAAADYPGAGNELLIAVAVRSGLEELMADSAKLTKYTAGATTEDPSVVFRNLQALHKVWNDKVAGLVGSPTGFAEESVKPLVRWGSFTGLASPVEVPDA